MLVYRIALEIHANALTASGSPARWNSRKVKAIYTSSSRALACLENIVHRGSHGLNSQFRTMVIEIPDNLKVISASTDLLVPNWQDFGNMTLTQKIGDQWVAEAKSTILRVPSVIVPEEFNFILNPAHKDFSKIKYLRNEPFDFDARLKNRGGKS